MEHLTEPLVHPGTTLPAVRAVYQPIVDLTDGSPVAFEALARGPAGSALESPAALFASAREAGHEAELDWLCRATAFRGALQARLPASTTLFVNAEPRWLATACPPQLASVFEQARQRLQVVVEITERALVLDPAGLLAAVRAIREAGWGVALDDIGADPASLALMPFVEPDVIKLDLRLVQQRTSSEIAMIVNAVAAQAERTGAVVVAEGIETDEHRRRALAMGATLGQGWLFARPGPLPGRIRPYVGEIAFTRPDHPDAGTPFQQACTDRTMRHATKELLLPLSHHLERHAWRASEPPVLLAAFEDATHFTPGTARRYASMVPRCAFVGALGAGMPAEPAPGVRGGRLDAGDPLAGEWVVASVGPHFAGALIAHDLGDTGPDRERRFAFTITYDRDVVVRSARTLLGRIARLR